MHEAFKKDEHNNIFKLKLALTTFISQGCEFLQSFYY